MLDRKIASIKDVARVAGVSTATVSRALSNPDLLTDATRDIVMEAVRSTGYRVNQAARNLRKKQAGAILVLVPNLGNPFFSEILAGISRGFDVDGPSVLITDTSERRLSAEKLVSYFLDSRIDGMISLDGSLTLDDLGVFHESGVADRIVFCCEWVHGMTLPSVRSDNVAGAQLAIRHLYDLGHRKIAHVTGPKGNVLTRMRREGMMQERERLGLQSRPEWIIRGDFSMRSGAEAAQQILQMQDRPTAVFCASDEVALGLISTMEKAGVRVPQDLSVVGFDDIDIAEFAIPSLTTIRQDRHKLGQSAAKLLQTILDRPDQSRSTPCNQVELINVELILRGSTGPVQG
jgi:LacI family transcriptional regulator, repressor for deo operon, udp, cdd, tsx, nupC, and nupG